MCDIDFNDRVAPSSCPCFSGIFPYLTMRMQSWYQKQIRALSNEILPTGTYIFSLIFCIIFFVSKKYGVLEILIFSFIDFFVGNIFAVVL